MEGLTRAEEPTVLAELPQVPPGGISTHRCPLICRPGHFRTKEINPLVIKA